jgi:putative Mg2+ transporter-C (MgtC) family protein
MDESEMRKMIIGYGFSIANLSSRLIEAGQHFEYRMTIKSRDRLAAEALSRHLRGLPEVTEFRISPMGD